MDKKVILKHALKNAYLHEGKADLKAVMNKVIGETDEKNMGRVGPEVKKVIIEVNKMDLEKQKKNLLKLDKHALDKKEEPEKELPELQKTKLKMKFRFAPNPNGPPTLGSSRGMVINWLYKLKYKGQYTLRFDDTDPKTKKPMLEAYDWYLEDCEWLGIKPNQVVYMSDHVLKYYEYAEKLIDLEKAYVCTCTQTKQQENRRFGVACEHRDTKKEINLKEWKKMLDGGYKAGQAVLKIKTDMQHKNPAVRDWVALRVLFEPHPRVGDKYKVWPMLDFAGAIEDYLNKTTHIIRGKDLRTSTERQEYMYKYLGWVYPVVNYWGRVSVEEFGKISTSGIKKGIEEGKYSGWDDPKLPTLRALRKRGIKPEAIVEFWEDMGLSERDVKASLEKLEALNQKYL